MITKLANDDRNELKLEQFDIAHYERRKSPFLFAFLTSLLIHGTIAAALSQAYFG